MCISSLKNKKRRKKERKKRQRLYRWKETLSSTMSGSILLVMEYVGTPCPSGQDVIQELLPTVPSARRSG